MKFVFLFLTVVAISVVLSLDPNPADSVIKNALPHELAGFLENCKKLHNIEDLDIRNEYQQRGSAGKNMKPFHACVAKAMGLVRIDF